LISAYSHTERRQFYPADRYKPPGTQRGGSSILPIDLRIQPLREEAVLSY
jgi:hypothetical protein